jgi:hypothetical protein
VEPQEGELVTLELPDACTRVIDQPLEVIEEYLQQWSQLAGRCQVACGIEKRGNFVPLPIQLWG